MPDDKQEVEELETTESGEVEPKWLTEQRESLKQILILLEGIVSKLEGEPQKPLPKEEREDLAEVLERIEALEKRLPNEPEPTPEPKPDDSPPPPKRKSMFRKKRPR